MFMVENWGNADKYEEENKNDPLSLRYYFGTISVAFVVHSANAGGRGEDAEFSRINKIGCNRCGCPVCYKKGLARRFGDGAGQEHSFSVKCVWVHICHLQDDLGKWLLCLSGSANTYLPGQLGGIRDLTYISSRHRAGSKVKAAAEGKVGRGEGGGDAWSAFPLSFWRETF